jgi:hypothetical protein
MMSGVRGIRWALAAQEREGYGPEPDEKPACCLAAGQWKVLSENHNGV